jgi:hypothetical protein
MYLFFFIKQVSYSDIHVMELEKKLDIFHNIITLKRKILSEST